MRVTTTLLFLFMTLLSYGQKTTYSVEGIVEDTLGNPLIYSTVLLLDKVDSTMVDYTRTELDGSFKVKDIPAGNYLIRSTYIGYIPLEVDASSPEGKDLNLGVLKMTEIGKELMEIVIKAAKAPIKMRGDTIEYDATTFKVPEGSTVEDLLRKLPGIEVGADGEINSDGKAVNRVTVDGKSFFGSDPKAATKNLPAEGISKVQVFDTKTEEEEITGKTGESQDKTMNLELKDAFKSGGFGKIIAGAGTREGLENTNRAELKGNFNRFNNKIQFSIVGVGNNTGRNGLSWNDYQDFMGSQSFNFSDGTDYGFGSGGRMFITFGGGGNSIEQSIQSVFFSGRQNSGFPENYNGGVNFNYDHNKTKLSTVYYYNQAGLTSPSTSVNDKFYEDFTQNSTSASIRDNVSKGHRMEIDFEKQLDSLHTIKVEFNGASIDQRNIYDNNVSLSRDNVLTSESDYNNDTRTDGSLINGLILLRKKFMKKGRSMGLNASYLTTNLNTDWQQNSNTEFFDGQGEISTRMAINQENIDLAEKQVFKVNALFVEPLSKKFFFQTFFNYRDRVEDGNRLVTELQNEARTINEFLSREYENTIGSYRIGSLVRYSHNGINISTGLAYQSFNLQGSFSSMEQGGISGIVDKKFNNLIPRVSVNFAPARNAYVDLGYVRQVSEPSIQDLQPLVDNINPLYIREGNAGLTPEVQHNVTGYLSKNYPLSGIRINMNANVSIFSNQFSTEETVDQNLVTRVKPINAEGGNRMWISGGLSFPIKKNRVTVRTNLGFNVNNRPSIVNGQDNNTRSLGFNPFMQINITPSTHYTLYINGSYGVTNTKYDLNPTQDQSTKNASLGLEANAKLIAGFFMNGSYNYNQYSNDRFNEDRSIPILNASLYRRFLPDNKLEVRVSIYDALDRNVGFFQGASGIGVSQTITSNLGRHLMLTMTYNIRGMQSDTRRNGWF